MTKIKHQAMKYVARLSDTDKTISKVIVECRLTFANSHCVHGSSRKSTMMYNMARTYHELLTVDINMDTTQ